MGIYLRLRSLQPLPYWEIPQRRLSYGLEVLRYFKDAFLFQPESIEFWRKAPSKALGGIQIEGGMDFSGNQEFEHSLALAKQAFNHIDEHTKLGAFAVVNGIWTFEENLELAGYLSIANAEKWREVYHDIEFEAYPRGDVSDLIDALWSDKEKFDIERVIPDFAIRMRQIEGSTDLTFRSIIFSYGVPSYDLSSMMAITAHEDKDVIDLLYRMKKEVIKSPELRDYMNAPFLLREIKESEVADHTLRSGMEEAAILVRQGGSVTVIAKHRDSFKTLYDKFDREIFHYVLASLDDDEAIAKRIREALEQRGKQGD